MSWDSTGMFCIVDNAVDGLSVVEKLVCAVCQLKLGTHGRSRTRPQFSSFLTQYCYRMATSGRVVNSALRVSQHATSYIAIRPAAARGFASSSYRFAAPKGMYPALFRGCNRLIKY